MHLGAITDELTWTIHELDQSDVETIKLTNKVIDQ